MRIVQVNKYHFVKGGAERYYLDLSEALRRHGHEVRHLSMAHPRNLAAGPGDRFVPEVDFRAGGSLGAKLVQGWRSIYHAGAAAHARALTRRAAWNGGSAGPTPVAHLHNIYHQLSPSIVLAFARAGVPVVQTLHDYKLVCPGYLLLTHGEICERCRGGRYFEAVRHRCLLDARGASLVGAVEAYLHRGLGTYGRVSRFLCPSRFLLEKVASFGIARDRLVHLPYFVPLERYRPSPVPDRPSGAPVPLVYIGRLSREKGIETLVRAMALLPAGRARLEVLGEGPLSGQIEESIARHCPDGRVLLRGYRTGEALFDAIRAAAFTVVPSEWYENLPFSILEPFALGRAVVGSRIGGIPELVRDGVTGRLFRPGDPGSLAEALLWMTGPEADLKGMGEEARRVIERDHAEEAHLDRLLAVYREVAA